MCDTKSNQGDMQDGKHSLIVRVVSSVLDKLICGHIDSPGRSSCGDGFLKFQSSYAPDVTVEAYLDRIRRYSRCSDACFVMALIYVDRLIEKRGLILTKLNVHRLLITSVMLAAKFHDDLFYNNAYYSKLGGLALKELNLLEADLLTQLNFSMFVHEGVYGKYSLQLQNYVFYLDVVPAPAAMGVATACVAVTTAPVSPCLAAYFNGAAQCPTRPPPAPTPASVTNPGLSLHLHLQHPAATLPFYPRSSASADWLVVPSPDNAHAKPNAFSDHYLTASSPLRIAPPRQMSLYQQQLQQQVQVGLYGTQSYVTSASFSAADLDAEQQLLQGMSPLVYPSQDVPLARSHSGGMLALGLACSTGRECADDSSATTCSTRTTSPYPSSGNLASYGLLLGGPASGSYLPSGMVLQRSGSSGTLGGPGACLPGQGNTYPMAGNLTWSSSGDLNLKLCSTPPQSGGRRPGPGLGSLSIQTDLALDCPYPLMRCDSNGSTASVSTPYARYEMPAQRGTAPSPYVAEDYRQQLYARQQAQAGTAYANVGGAGYGSAYYDASQPSPSLYRSAPPRNDRELLTARYGEYAAMYGPPGFELATGDATPGYAPAHLARIVTPQTTPAQYQCAAAGGYHQYQMHPPAPMQQAPMGYPQAGQHVAMSSEPTATGPEGWSCGAVYGQGYHRGGALLSAGAV